MSEGNVDEEAISEVITKETGDKKIRIEALMNKTFNSRRLKIAETPNSRNAKTL